MSLFQTVLACGTFDLLHPGHLYFLRQAKKYGKKLVVIVARDQTVKRLKKHFPQESEAIRLKKIKALNFVDQAYLGSLSAPYRLLKKIKPDLICLGYDQKFYACGLKEKLKILGLPARIKRIGGYKTTIYKSSKMFGRGRN